MCCPPRVVYDGLHFLNTQGSLVRCCQEIGFFFLPVFLFFVGERCCQEIVFFFCLFFWFLWGKAGYSRGTVELAITGQTWIGDPGNVKSGGMLPPSQLFCSL